MDRRLTRREAALAIAGAAALPLLPAAAPAAGDVTAAEARAIAAKAYVYGFPLVDLYRICWGYFADTGGPAFLFLPQPVLILATQLSPSLARVVMPAAKAKASRHAVTPQLRPRKK